MWWYVTCLTFHILRISKAKWILFNDCAETKPEQKQKSGLFKPLYKLLTEDLSFQDLGNLMVWTCTAYVSPGKAATPRLIDCNVIKLRAFTDIDTTISAQDQSWSYSIVSSSFAHAQRCSELWNLNLVIQWKAPKQASTWILSWHRFVTHCFQDQEWTANLSFA